MPHQCLKCSEVYDNASDVIIKGCPNCGHKLFLFLKKMPNKKEVELSQDEKDLVMKEIESITDIDELDAPVVLNLESVRVLKQGKYEIDINSLMKGGKPLIYKVQDGTYMIDLNTLGEVRSEDEE